VALSDVALNRTDRRTVSPKLGLAAGAVAFLLVADVALGQVQSAPPMGEGVKALTASDWLAITIRIAAPLVLVILFLADFIRPGSFQRAGKRDVVAYQWPVWLFGAFVVVSAQIFGAQAFSQLTGLWEWLAGQGGPVQPLGESETRDTALTHLGSVIFGVFAGAVMVYLLNKREHDEGMRFGVRDVPLGLLAVVIAFPVVAAAGEASRLAFEYASGQEQSTVAHATLEMIRQNSDDPWTWVIIFTAILGAAVIEELIFRAFVQTALLRMLGSAWLAVIITSAIFALVHRANDAVPWHAIPALFVLGLAIGVAYERFKGLGVPIAMHAGFNAINIALVLWMADPAPRPTQYDEQGMTATEQVEPGQPGQQPR
jgi:membrane protease YdiL (CAAX protease family)